MEPTRNTAPNTRRLARAVGVVALAVAVMAPVASAAPARTKLASVRTNGTQADDSSHVPATSANGRFIVFYSAAKNLVGSDPDFIEDVFLRDRKNKKTKRMSKGIGGSRPDGDSTDPAISASGRFVVFQSNATNLIGSDGNSLSDIFRYDRVKKKTRRVSVKSGGGEATGESYSPSVSADGRFIAFVSDADDLVSGDNNGKEDVFVHDRKKKRTKRVSIKTGGGEANGDSDNAAISANGRFVAFDSKASDLVGSDGNDARDVFVHDRKTKKTKRVSIKTGGGGGNGRSLSPTISADGRFVAFESDATNLVGSDSNDAWDIFVHDRTKKRTKRVSVKTGGAESVGGDSFDSSISGSGRFIAFESGATNLVGTDTNALSDVFVHDRKKKRTKRRSVGKNGKQADDASFDPSLSADGRHVAFHSRATNLVGNDDNNEADIFNRGPLR